MTDALPALRSDSGSATPHEVQDDRDDREHDDDVNESTQVYREEPEGPEHKQDRSEGEQHVNPHSGQVDPSGSGNCRVTDRTVQ